MRLIALSESVLMRKEIEVEEWYGLVPFSSIMSDEKDCEIKQFCAVIYFANTVARTLIVY